MAYLDNKNNTRGWNGNHLKYYKSFVFFYTFYRYDRFFFIFFELLDGKYTENWFCYDKWWKIGGFIVFFILRIYFFLFLKLQKRETIFRIYTFYLGNAEKLILQLFRCIYLILIVYVTKKAHQYSI